MENENVNEDIKTEVNERKVVDFVWQDKYNLSAKSISEGRIFTITDENVDKVVEVPYIVKDLIPEHSVGIISGLPGAGKTWVALHLGYCIATGQKFLNKFDVISPGSVMYLSFEGSLDILKKRAKMIKTIDAPNCLIYDARGKLINKNEENDVEIDGQSIPNRPLISETTFKAQENNVKLIVIDTLRASLDGEENSSTDIATYLRAINEISVISGASVLILHHIGKGEVSDYTNIYQIARGSSALPASVDYAFGLKMVSDENDNEKDNLDENNTNMILYQAKNRNGKQLAPLDITMNEFNNKITFSSHFELKQSVIKKQNIAREMIEEIEENNRKRSKITKTSLTQKAKANRNVRERIFDAFLNDGIIRQDDNGSILLNILDKDKLEKYLENFSY